MTKAVLKPRDDLLVDADIDGIGDRTAQRLEAVGITSVGELADANAAELAGLLADGFPRLKMGTLQRKVARWIALANEVVGAAGRARGGHVFLLTLWVDADGVPLRSRFGYRSTDEPISEEDSLESAGWSPLTFARFVEQAAGLSQSRGLSEERVGRTEVVEWSRHRIEGQLVRRGSTTDIRAEIPTGGLDTERGEIRWRASGRLVPLGGGAQVALGSRAGNVAEGEAIELVFGSPPIDDTVHRAWFDLALSPAAEAERLPLEVGARSDADR
jgi:Domain of unknown function (DUF4332)